MLTFNPKMFPYLSCWAFVRWARWVWTCVVTMGMTSSKVGTPTKDRVYTLGLTMYIGYTFNIYCKECLYIFVVLSDAIFFFKRSVQNTDGHRARLKCVLLSYYRYLCFLLKMQFEMYGVSIIHRIISRKLMW